MMNYRSFLPFAIVFLFMVSGPINTTVAIASGTKPVSTVDMGELLQSGKVKDRFEGKENAPVTIVEYASLTCIHCAHFYNDVLPQIRKKYIKTGKVRLIFRDYAFDPRATAGFMLARCAPEDRYFPMIEVLFQKQQEWVWEKDALTPLKKIGLMAGFTDESFTACLKNQSILDEVNASFERGKELGVTATPTFFINGNKYEGVMSVESFFSVIDSFLKN
ncbi:DsbA family protein [Bartonella vinsonii]|uniref:DSBA oxidoreductase n=1 Tax=Bartonella vinsonii subsp. berkhoffii str. Tweed TaxID=1094502 RepID=N6VVN4_BARVB|nr:DsbA family protein [Bartonella vinsonii]ENN95187.1 DSBA oxidoreductase [Bartonella vinsonii subsp. berkhoffii str. Tweed]